MKITLITVGKTSFDFVKEGMAMYEKRIGRYLSYTRIEIPALSGTSSLTPEEVKEKEGILILKKIKEGDRVVLLDERGQRYSSTAWAARLSHLADTGCRSLVFVIGGAWGFSPKIKAAAAKGMKLRYASVIENTGVPGTGSCAGAGGKNSVSVKVGFFEVPPDAPLADIRCAESIFVFTTRYYSPFPLVLQGYGSNTETSAAGLFADILRTASW